MADLKFLNQGEVHEDRDAVVAEWVGYAEAVAPPHWVWVGSCSQFQKKIEFDALKWHIFCFILAP